MPYMTRMTKLAIAALCDLSSDSIALANNEVHSPSSFMVYPNPSKDQLYITLYNFYSEEIHAELYNQLGKSILSKQIIPINNTNTMDISEVENGIYLLQLTDVKTGSTHTQRIFVLR
jgi:hypothetical protein